MGAPASFKNRNPPTWHTLPERQGNPGPATRLRSCAATPRPTVRTEPPGVDSRHPSTPLRGYAEAGGSNEAPEPKGSGASSVSGVEHLNTGER